MAYLDSSKIKMFPSAYRSQSVDVESFYTTEGNLTKSSTLGYAHKSFVIEGSDGKLTIVIAGYRFEVSKADLKSLFPNSLAIFADIKLVDKGSGNTFSTLVSYVDGASVELDSTSNPSKFVGLYFDDDDNGLTTNHICVLEKIPDSSPVNYRVPSASKLILESNQIEDSQSSNPINEEFNTNALSANSINVKGGTQSSSISTGDIVVDGGVGVAKNLNVGGSVTADTITASGAGFTSMFSPDIYATNLNNRAVEDIFEPNSTIVKVASSANHANEATYADSTDHSEKLKVNTTTQNATFNIAITRGSDTWKEVKSTANVQINPYNGDLTCLGKLTVEEISTNSVSTTSLNAPVQYGNYKSISSADVTNIGQGLTGKVLDITLSDFDNIDGAQVNVYCTTDIPHFDVVRINGHSASWVYAPKLNDSTLKEGKAYSFVTRVVPDSVQDIVLINTETVTSASHADSANTATIATNAAYTSFTNNTWSYNNSPNQYGLGWDFGEYTSAFENRAYELQMSITDSETGLATQFINFGVVSLKRVSNAPVFANTVITSNQIGTTSGTAIKYYTGIFYVSTNYTPSRLFFQVRSGSTFNSSNFNPISANATLYFRRIS